MRIIAIISILALIGCKKDRLKDEKEILIGKWKWVYTEKRIRWLCQGTTEYSILTPQTENSNFSMEFEKKGCVKFYENDSEIDKYRVVFGYFYMQSSDLYSGYYQFEIKLNNKDDKTMYGYVKGDTLIEVGRWFPFKGDNESCLSYTNYFVRE